MTDAQVDPAAEFLREWDDRFRNLTDIELDTVAKLARVQHDARVLSRNLYAKLADPQAGEVEDHRRALSDLHASVFGAREGVRSRVRFPRMRETGP